MLTGYCVLPVLYQLQSWGQVRTSNDKSFAPSFVCVNSTRAWDVWEKGENEYLLCICYVVETEVFYLKNKWPEKFSLGQ